MLVTDTSSFNLSVVACQELLNHVTSNRQGALHQSFAGTASDALERAPWCSCNDEDVETQTKAVQPKQSGIIGMHFSKMISSGMASCCEAISNYDRQLKAQAECDIPNRPTR